jgi:3-methyladenine DNA glycosylase AlkD
MGEDRKKGSKLRAQGAMELQQIRKRLRQLANPERAKVSLRYFKTAPGQYGAGDQFIGNTVPDLRKLSRENQNLAWQEVLELLHSPIHEERALALLILNLQFRPASEQERTAIHRLYLKNTAWINNWDLVDSSAEIIVGEYLLDKDVDLLHRLADSKSLWERRIAMIAGFAFVKRQRFDVPISIAKQLMRDTEDLIHKAAGWMLREIGKRDLTTLQNFLNRHAAFMPRTMLRYAIEKFPEQDRQKYLSLYKNGNSRRCKSPNR